MAKTLFAVLLLSIAVSGCIAFSPALTAPLIARVGRTAANLSPSIGNCLRDAVSQSAIRPLSRTAGSRLVLRMSEHVTIVSAEELELAVQVSVRHVLSQTVTRA